MIKKAGALLITLSFLVLGPLACTSPMHKSVSKVKVGMEKDQVLDILGSPKMTREYKGKQQWKYIYYKNDIRRSKVVTFHFGEVVSIGKVKTREALLRQAEAANSLDEYTRKIKEYKDAQIN